jgi:hypothetical protein
MSPLTAKRDRCPPCLPVVASVGVVNVEINQSWIRRIYSKESIELSATEHSTAEHN